MADNRKTTHDIPQALPGREFDWQKPALGDRRAYRVLRSASDVLPLGKVTTSSPGALQTLAYDATAGAWVNRQIGTGDLADFTIAAPASPQTLVYNGTHWVNRQLATTDLSDMAEASRAADQVLQWNGTAWENRTVLSLTLTDTGGGADADTLRPAILVLQHNTSATTVAGVGLAQYYQCKDVAGTVVRIGKEIAEVTTPTAGAVDSTMAWCVMKGGTEVEVFRARGGQGMAVTDVTGSGGSVANNKAGGQLWARSDFFHSGPKLGFYATTPAVQGTVTGSRGAATVAVLTDLLAKLALTGIIADGTTA